MNMPIDIKICGLSKAESVAAALAGGASHVGFIFFAKSPRNVTPEKASELASGARGSAKIVAVTVDADDAFLDEIVATLKPDLLQLHGSESPERIREIKHRYGLPVMKAVSVREASDLDRIVAYRLSGSARLPGIGPLPRFWREAVSEEIGTAPGVVVDMLSSPYASMVRLPASALTIKVWQQDAGRPRTAVSHFNKATKGELARLLATVTPEPRTAQQVLSVLRTAGWRAELDGSRLDVWMRG